MEKLRLHCISAELSLLLCLLPIAPIRHPLDPFCVAPPSRLARIYLSPSPRTQRQLYTTTTCNDLLTALEASIACAFTILIPPCSVHGRITNMLPFSRAFCICIAPHNESNSIFMTVIVKTIECYLHSLYASSACFI